MKNDDTLSNDLFAYFSEIAKRLWSGHATVMVGAGFSKNAKKNDSTLKSFPDWNQLGDVFYKKINGSLPTDERYLNVLKLADEVQAAYGRNTLDHILRKEIPDKEYLPSKVHEKLMRLPWMDVFTTNYDTLLERTAENVTNQRFDVVINKEDLVYSAKPRIIKLHGSFPSERPFIITEDDYRRYPKEFAPFVNTVQQSLLENTLCLIGFSGNDPNFLQWIGWIRDNLGEKNSPKIYLIGILALSAAQKRLLEQRNIIPLDLSHCIDNNGDHEAALLLFLNFLHKAGKVEENLGWPTNNDVYSYKHDQDLTKQITSIIENWISVRKKYPNWLIVPEDRRDILKIYTKNSISFVYHLSKVESPNDIRFLYELNWRIEKCLIPIYNDLIEHYENVINNYNPFPNKIKIKNAITPSSKDKKGLNWKEITFKWFKIQLSMMRFYREEGFHEKWLLLTTRLNTLIEKLKPEFQARYYYERCLYNLFALNITEVKNELDVWPVNKTLPFWETKRAGLLAEVGDVIEAEKILDDTLNTIRGRLNLTPIVNDYSNVSKEAYIMQLLKYVKSSANNLQGVYSIADDISKSYTERWNILIQYKCDPWAELKSLKIYLDKEPTEFKEVEKKQSFDIGHVSTTHKFGGYDKYVFKAYSYLRYIEEIGIPPRLPGMIFGKEAVQGSIKHIATHSPYWAFVTFIRLGDAKIIDSIFNRKSIASMNLETINNFINEYLSVLENAVNEIANGDTFRNNNFAISLATTIPEVLSRLCVKSSHDLKLKLLSFLKNLYSSELRDRYRGIRNLSKRLIGSFSKCNQYQAIPLLLEFPILPELSPLIDNEYIDPINFIIIDKRVLRKTPKISIAKKIINEILDAAKKSNRIRQNALNRLIKLWELDCLSQTQTKQLGKILWSKVDKNTGFPINTGYYKFAFSNFPHPANINPEYLLKTFITASEFPIQATEKEKGVTLGGGDYPIFHEIIGTLNINYTWSKKDISLLIKKAVEWWDADKKCLIEKETRFRFGSIRNEFKSRFQNLVSIFSTVIFSNYKLIEKTEKKELERILDEFEEYGILNIESKASCLQLLPNTHKKIFDSIYESLFSKSNSRIIDAVKGFKKLLEVHDANVSDLLQIISEYVRGRNEIGLISVINIIAVVVKDYPELINDKILSNLKTGLTNLIPETEISPQDTIENIDSKLSLKREAAYLTVALNEYFDSQKKTPPTYINNWKAFCLDKNEFSEIRMIWEDTQ